MGKLPAWPVRSFYVAHGHLETRPSRPNPPELKLQPSRPNPLDPNLLLLVANLPHWYCCKRLSDAYVQILGHIRCVANLPCGESSGNLFSAGLPVNTGTDYVNTSMKNYHRHSYCALQISSLLV